jgi:hypothetical protein
MPAKRQKMEAPFTQEKTSHVVQEEEQKKSYPARKKINPTMTEKFDDKM